ncbi:MAG: DNA mismatch repair protein MutS [Alphaproteobacteria bacterium]|nr:DNA mismatch repair protein MutS [Alphaproteobacteria bacterium]
MKSKRPLKPEERQIWRKVAKSVTPLDESRTQSLDQAEPSDPTPKLKTASTGKKPKDKPSHHPHQTPPRHHHVPVPVDRSAEKRVRRGKMELDARIDLHGLTQAQALSTLTHFIRMAYQEGYRNVLVITGKGLKARERDSEPWEYPEEPGVLRRKLPEWLGNPTLRQWVSGYSSSHVRHGGSGAFYVTLRTRKLDAGRR